MPTRPSHPAPDTRDDREAPLSWARDARTEPQISEKRKKNVSRRALETLDRFEGARKISFSAPANSIIRNTPTGSSSRFTEGVPLQIHQA